MQPRLLVRAGVIASTLVVGLVGLWAAETLGPNRREAVSLAAQVQPIFRREDVRPTLKTPSASAREFFFTRAIFLYTYKEMMN